MSISDEPVLRAPIRSFGQQVRGQDHPFMKVYRNMFIVMFLTTFAVTWRFAITEYGGLVGYGLGWIPAIVIGMIFAGMWPVGIVLGGAVFMFMRVLHGS